MISLQIVDQSSAKSLSDTARTRGAVAFLCAVAALLLAPTVHAQDYGEQAYDAWTSAFLVTRDLGDNPGMTFFAKALTGPDHDVPDDTWRLAFAIMTVEDTYLHTRNPEQLALIDKLLSDYMQFYGTDFSWNQWNDDLAWISIAFLRGYQIVGKQEFLDMSTNLWNLAYDRGWDDELGGGIWENPDERPGKEALSNNPFVFSGVHLYEITGDQEYLRKATEIYAWVREHLFDAETGQVHQGYDPPGMLNPGDNVYNSGTFIIAANNLYRIYGDTSYYDDALKAIDFVLAKGPILRSSDNTQNGSWAYWFVKGLAEFCNDNDVWDQYQDYLDNNAQSSWANRDPQTQLTGNDWAEIYTFADTDVVGPMPSHSGVAIWALIEPNVDDAGAGGAGGTAGNGGVPAVGGAGGNGGVPAVGGSGDSGGTGTVAGSGGSVAGGDSGGAIAGSGGSGTSGGSTGAIVDSGGSAAGGSVVPTGGSADPALANAAGPTDDSGCSCVLPAGANRKRSGLALAGLLGLLLLRARRRKSR